MSSTIDSNSGSLGELTDGTFETVADALHLQNSVIGMVYWCCIHLLYTVNSFKFGGCSDRMVVRFTTTYAIRTYLH